MSFKSEAITVLASALLMQIAFAGQAPGAATPNDVTVTADIVDASGKALGIAVVSDTPQGIVLQLDAAGLPPGKHGVHLHETGSCERPSFKSAGGHFNPGSESHGYLDGDGHHAGDLPNQIVTTNGELVVSLHAPDIRLNTGGSALIDGDGSALIVHAGVDDYSSQPSGDAGKRIACAAFTRGLMKKALGPGHDS